MAESAAASMGIGAEAQVQDLNGLLDDMKAALEAAGITTPIYTGWQPADPGDCITLNEYAGRPPETLVEVETPGLQIRIRGEAGENDYQKTRALSQTIFNLLHDKKNFKAGAGEYIHVTAQQSPFFLERDINNRPEFIINFLVMKVRK